MDKPKIFMNGQEIDPRAVEHLPESVRNALVDANNNGIPDIVENVWSNPHVQQALSNVNIDHLPAPAQAVVKKFMNKFGPPSLGGPTASTQNFDWKAIEQANAPKTIPVRVVVFSVAVIFALILAAWIVLMALRSS